jgi:peptidoglycan lytic transglycosylase D
LLILLDLELNFEIQFGRLENDFMRAPSRLLPAAVIFVILIAGFAAEVGAQALDSAGAEPAETPADSVAVQTAQAQTPETLAQTPLEPLKASALPAGVVEIHGRGQDLPVPLNQRVLSYVELFQGRLHEYIEGGMKRGSQYLPMIQQVFRTEGLPLDLAYVPLIESSFRPEAMSRASAKGVWQFMKGTALENGLKHDWYVDERSDPRKATVAAANYLKTLADMFGGDWHLALASYNSGPGRVQRAMKQTGRSDYWSISAKAQALPRETREYVPMILAAIVIARNPAQYGFSFESSSPESKPTFETVAVSHPVDLRRVAEWAGTTLATIHELNPELRRQTTPKNSAYELKVPLGTSAEIARHLNDAEDVPLPSEAYYTVKRGDTLPTIARKFRISRSELAEANDMSANARLTAGQRVIIPGEFAPTRPAPSSTSTRLPSASPNRPALPDVSPASSSIASVKVKSEYRVRQGDTLTSIAELFDTSVKTLQSWNPQLGGTRVVVGQRLTVYKQ